MSVIQFLRILLARWKLILGTTLACLVVATTVAMLLPKRYPASARVRLDAADKPFDRLEAEKSEFHARVRDAYLALAAGEPERFLVLDATLPPSELAAAVRARVADALA